LQLNLDATYFGGTNTMNQTLELWGILSAKILHYLAPNKVILGGYKLSIFFHLIITFLF
jgi:hypothetical protein